MSLRLRLLIGVLVVSLVGLIAAEVITLAAARASLLARTDDRLDALTDPAQRRLLDQNATDRTERSAAARFGRATGYYAELQDANGNVVDRTEPAPTATPAPLPDIPSVTDQTKLPSQSIGSGDAFTVGSVSDAGFEWRVQAVRVSVEDNSDTLFVALPLTDVQGTLRSLFLIEILVTAIVFVGITAFGWWVVRVGLRPLRDMEETAEHIAAGDLSRRVEPADDRTEIGRLGSALNRMLSQIEEAADDRRRSEERLRQFVADASHELRTPVTAISGYADLYRQHLLEGDELDRAMLRIGSESSRMASLTEDLLTLARLDLEKQPVRERTDLAGVVSAAVSDARAIEPDRPLTCRVPEGAVPVAGDRDRLHQVVANLLANVRAHTPAGAPAEVTLTARSGQAVLTVADRGPGIPPELGAAVFERFRRADPARSRGRGGAGLGLAIVAAIVAAHGGQVTASNRMGGGASIVISLPLAPAVDEDSSPAVRVASAEGAPGTKGSAPTDGPELRDAVTT